MPAGTGPKARAHALLECAACFSSLLRTDSVNRGLCISFFTLEMILLASSVRSSFFFIYNMEWNARRICPQRLTMSFSRNQRFRIVARRPFEKTDAASLSGAAEVRFGRARP